MLHLCAFTSCNKEEEQTDSINNTLKKITFSTTNSVGEEHNRLLEELFAYLENQNVNSDNVNSHVYDFFDFSLSQENILIAERYYNYNQQNNADLYIDFTSNLKIETENLLSIIDSSDFSNLENFKVAVRDYELVTELSEAELYAWEVYTDVFIHSFEYWDNNLDSWAQLIGGSETTTLGSDCTEGGWFRRTWCKIKNFVLSDASGAAGEVLVAFAFNNPIVFGGVVVAGLSSSAGAAIWNIVKNLL